MLHVMLLALALSWDSFFVGFLSGCLDLNRPSRRYLAMLFGLCDGAAVAIGLLAAGAPLVRLGQIFEGTWILPWLLLVLLVLERLIRPAVSRDHVADLPGPCFAQPR